MNRKIVALRKCLGQHLAKMLPLAFAGIWLACASTPPESRTENHFSRYALVTAHPLATQAGLEMLEKGGSAVDAAIAVQMALTLVEPQSSGIGGGSFLMYYDGKKVYAFDGRETAPAKAGSDLFIQDGKPMEFMKAVVGGRSVGTPGAVRMLAEAHRRYGRLPWADLFAPAIRYASEGFAVTPRLNTLLQNDKPLREIPRARAYFYQADGNAWPVGHILRNPALADVFQRIAREGEAAFYGGEIAQAMVKEVTSHPSNPGLLSIEDISKYKAVERQPICTSITNDNQGYQVCGFPPPSSGMLTMAQILGVLTEQSQPVGAAFTPDGLHVYTEASRLAYADRASYLADPDFVSAPGGDWNRLLNPVYLKARAALIGPKRMAKAEAGSPPGAALTWAAMPDQVELGTSHLSIIDQYGNAVSMTTTVEGGFGSRLMVGLKGEGGFLLNNELTDFSFAANDEAGKPIANRVEPGKRPRSSMNPLIVFQQKADGTRGELHALLGSPGGSAIIHYTTRTVIGLFYQGLSPQEVVAQPNVALSAPNGELMVEADTSLAEKLQALQDAGHQPKTGALTSGIQVLQRHGDGWRGGSDPRREGVAAGK